MIDKYHEHVKKIVHKAIPCYEDAEEVVQDVMLRLWRFANMRRDKTPEKERAWVNTVTRNQIKSYYSKTKSPVRNAAAEHETCTEVQRATTTKTPAQEILAKEELAIVMNAIRKGAVTRQGQAFIMAVMHGKTSAEIAQLFGVSSATIRTWVFRFRQMLHKCVDTANGC